jgi:hypothetical protein
MHYGGWMGRGYEIGAGRYDQPGDLRGDEEDVQMLGRRVGRSAWIVK